MLTATRPTVLIVDDEPDVRELARVVLEMDGFEIAGEAVDGGEAIQRFVELDPPPVPSVVLLDNRMPVLSGLDAAERILERHPSQLIVLFTAFLDEVVEARAHEIGIARCVSKMEAVELPQILRDLMA